MQWSRAFSLVCEVAFGRQLTLVSIKKKIIFVMWHILNAFLFLFLFFLPKEEHEIILHHSQQLSHHVTYDATCEAVYKTVT